MKLRNKKTGEIENLIEIKNIDNRIFARIERPPLGDTYKKEIHSLAELNEKWEDYEKPKGYWFIDYDGRVHKEDYAVEEEYKDMLEIGNYFETKEEAEKAADKFKAWKRLKDAGFKFNNWIYDYREAENENKRGLSIGASYNQLSKINVNDINLLFGGEE